LQRAEAGAEGPGDAAEVFERLSQEVDAVADVLNRRVDLVGDPRCELPDGLELLALPDLHLHALTVAQIRRDADGHARQFVAGASGGHRDEDGNVDPIQGPPDALPSEDATLDEQRMALVLRDFDLGLEVAERATEDLVPRGAEQPQRLFVGAEGAAESVQNEERVGQDAVDLPQEIVGPRELLLDEVDLALLSAESALERPDVLAGEVEFRLGVDAQGDGGHAGLQVGFGRAPGDPGA